ncbi:MAG TPA: ketopantoate reductase family protein [Steroidobacter sp.]|uniref:ketopantoate reductase family protein n=1 Tax=Steroidobacter sp. TaxID=1978227 RepID=UPI002EDA1360
MRMLVVGAGSTGGYFGGRLAAAGRDVTFLVRQRRAEQLRKTGLQIVSPSGDLTLAPKLLTADQIESPFDVALLTVKAYALEQAVEDFSPAVGAETIILPVLNGMKHMDVLTSRFATRNVAGCICKIASTLDDEGRIIELANFHEIAYGELDGSTSERMTQLDAFMRDAGFVARISPAIQREMWEKWTFLASLGAINSLMRGSIGEVARAPGGQEFANALLDEVLSVVKTVGVAPTEKYSSIIRAQLTDPKSTLTSSMYRDLQQGYPIESEQIVGNLVERARNAGLSTPLLSAAYANLSVHSARPRT